MGSPGLNAAQRGFAPAIVTARGGEGGMARRSDDAHIQYWLGRDIPVEIHSEEISSVYRAWAAESAQGLPRLGAMLTSEAKVAALDSLLLLKLPDDYLIVSQGSNCLRNLGKDIQGRLHSELRVPIEPIMRDLYDRCHNNSEPIYSRYVSDLSPSSLYWESLMLPVKSDEKGHASLVLNYLLPVDSKADILQMILDRSATGVIAAVPYNDSKGSIDGRVVAVNAKAKELLKFDANGSQVHFIRELAPWFRDKAGWTRMSISSEGKNTRIDYRDDTDHWYSVTMESLRRFVLFSIEEIAKPAS